MKLVEPMPKQHRLYTKVSNQKRLQVIHLIHNLQYSIKEASRISGVGYENCKAIYRVFRKSGRISQLSNVRNKNDDQKTNVAIPNLDVLKKNEVFSANKEDQVAPG